jgi:hypothetical protein
MCATLAKKIILKLMFVRHFCIEGAVFNIFFSCDTLAKKKLSFKYYFRATLWPRKSCFKNIFFVRPFGQKKAVFKILFSCDTLAKKKLFLKYFFRATLWP